MNLQERVVLITGAGTRLGQQIAIDLARRKMRIAIHYHRSIQGAQETLKQMSHPEEHRLFQANLCSLSELKNLVVSVERDLGPIAVLINNAADFYASPLGEATESQWDQLMDLNLKAPFFLSQEIGILMKQRGIGKIINLADVAGEKPWIHFLPYCISKAGVLSLTKGLAKALAPEVQVNAIAPGTVLPPPDGCEINTQRSIEQSLLKRMGSPEDIVNAVRFFLENDFLTGVILPVDGGRMLT